MNRQEIEAAVRTIIAEHLKIDPAKVVDDASFDALGADSLDTIEIPFVLETHFDVEINDAEDEALRTVGDVFDLIDRKLVMA